MTKKCAVNPYLVFDGRCQEAIDFYRSAIGAELLMVTHYKDAPAEAKAQQQQCGPAIGENKVMHARLRIGDSTIMLSDGPGSGKFDGFSLSLTAPTPADAERLFTALSAGGRIEMPLNKTFFSPAFGVVSDRFGVKWMIFVDPSV